MTSIKKSIIKDSIRIRTAIAARITELKLTAKQVVVDADERGMAFTSASLSKYLNHGNVASTLSEENIVWLCLRYGIPINLFVGKAVMDKNKINFVIPSYNEKECLTNLEKVFQHETTINNK